jgi:hypothetical protein
MAKNGIYRNGGGPTILTPNSKGDYDEHEFPKRRAEGGFKPSFRNDMSTSRKTRPLELDALSSLVRNNPETALARIEDLISDGKFGLRSVKDLKATFRAFHDIPVKTQVEIVPGIRSSVTTSAFPLLMGSLVVDEINRAYEEVPTIGSQLVRDMESNKKFAHVVKIVNNVGQELTTPEGTEFPMISAGEQFAVIGNKRKGFQLAITQETLEENDVGNFLALVDQGGQFAAELIEEQTLSRVSDQNGSNGSPIEPYVFRPGGTATAMYSTTANLANQQTPSGTRINSNPLTSVVNLDACRLVLAAMQNTRSRRIGIPMSEQLVLVPNALLSVILTIPR